MSDEELDIDEIRGRAEAATCCDWRIDETRRVVYAHHAAYEHFEGGRDTDICRVQTKREDAELIISARQDIPALCDEVERLREENKSLREALEDISQTKGMGAGGAASLRAKGALEGTDE